MHPLKFTFKIITSTKMIPPVPCHEELIVSGSRFILVNESLYPVFCFFFGGIHRSNDFKSHKNVPIISVNELVQMLVTRTLPQFVEGQLLAETFTAANEGCLLGTPNLDFIHGSLSGDFAIEVFKSHPLRIIVCRKKQLT